MRTTSPSSASLTAICHDKRCGKPKRPAGLASTNVFAISGGMERHIGVSIKPGQTAFTRMPLLTQFTITPPPFFSICGISWRMQYHTPVKSQAIMRCQFSTVQSAVGTAMPSMPAPLNAASKRLYDSTA